MRLRQMLFAAAVISPAAVGAQMGVSVAWPVAAGSRVRILSPVLGDQRQTDTGEREAGLQVALGDQRRAGGRRGLDAGHQPGAQVVLAELVGSALRRARTGEVLETRLTSTSGNDQFDAAVLAAVKKASPFSPPPDHLRDALQKQGIVLDFRP